MDKLTATVMSTGPRQFWRAMGRSNTWMLAMIQDSIGGGGAGGSESINQGTSSTIPISANRFGGGIELRTPTPTSNGFGATAVVNPAGNNNNITALQLMRVDQYAANNTVKGMFHGNGGARGWGFMPYPGHGNWGLLLGGITGINLGLTPIINGATYELIGFTLESGTWWGWRDGFKNASNSGSATPNAISNGDGMNFTYDGGNAGVAVWCAIWNRILSQDDMSRIANAVRCSRAVL